MREASSRFSVRSVRSVVAPVVVWSVLLPVAMIVSVSVAVAVSMSALLRVFARIVSDRYGEGLDGSRGGGRPDAV